MLNRFDQQRIKSTREQDAPVNEVLMQEDSAVNVVKEEAFREISARVGRPWCPYACATLPNAPFNTVDIHFSSSRFKVSNLSVPGGDDSADAGEIPFNTCEGVAPQYGAVVHEAGHALGISDGITGGHLHDGQGQYHSHIMDSLMSYSSNDAFNCSPNPFDIMAMYALYQSR